MTAPALVVPTLPSGIPIWSVDEFTVHGSYMLDELGREWGVEDGTDDDWDTPAPPRTKRDDRPDGHGTTRGIAWRGGKTFTLGGYVGCPSSALREQSALELATVCSDPGREYTFRRRTDSFDHVMDVELDGSPLIKKINLYTLRWQFTFHARDPRKHDATWQDPIVNPVDPATQIDGLVFDEPGLDFSGAGLDFLVGSEPASPGRAQVANYGSAPTHPVFKLTGPLATPEIRHLESGRLIRYLANIAAGEIVRINCGDFPARGLLEHECVSTTRGDVRSLVHAGMDWPVVGPREVASFQLTSPGSAPAELMASLRSAWW